MSTDNVKPFHSEVEVLRQERKEYRARVRANSLLAQPVLFPGKASCIAVISGRRHLEMGRRTWILENKYPVGGIAELLPESEIIYGHTGGTIDAFVSIGSSLSNQWARILDGHAETLERVRQATFGSFFTEFDASNKSIVSYIEDERVTEPFRVIVNEGNRKQAPIFEPKPHQGIAEVDALVIKVLRNRIGGPSILRIEGWGPAGTVYGFRMLLEDRDILSELAGYAARWDSFEAVIVVKNVYVKEDALGRKSMAAKGPLEIVGCEPIREPDEGIDTVWASLKTPDRFIARREKATIHLPTVREQRLVLRVQKEYNRGYEYTATAVPLPRKDFVERKKFSPSQELRKLKHDVKEKTRGLSDEKINEVLRVVFSVVPNIIDAQLVEGMTSEEIKQKISGLVKKEGVVFESQPKPKEPLTPPHLSEIPLWQGRIKGGMPLDFIEDHYGQWLSAFGAEEDTVFQDQIRAHDPKLMRGLVNQLHEEGSRRKVADFVRPRVARTQLELEQFDLDTLKRARRAQDLLRRQQPKKA